MSVLHSRSVDEATKWLPLDFIFPPIGVTKRDVTVVAMTIRNYMAALND